MQKVSVQRFEVSSAKVKRHYEGRDILSLDGQFHTKKISLQNWTLIPTSNSNRMLIFSLLEPESEDGYVAWHMLGDSLAAKPFPVVKVRDEVSLK